MKTTPGVYKGKSCGGFTLVELLIAMSVFAVLALLSYGGLRTVLESQQRGAEQADRLARLQLVYRLLERDLQQMVKRGIRNEFGDKVSFLVVGTDVKRTMEFTRGGWRNPAGRQRSNLQRVAYAIRDNELVRESWLVLDRAQNSKPREQKLLDDVEQFQVRMLDRDDQWQIAWPPPQQGTKDSDDEERLPRVVELTLELKDWGTLTWLFQVST